MTSYRHRIDSLECLKSMQKDLDDWVDSWYSKSEVKPNVHDMCLMKLVVLQELQLAIQCQLRLAVSTVHPII